MNEQDQAEPLQPLDDLSRRQDLRAAAEALHHWAYTRRATWSTVPLEDAIAARAAGAVPLTGPAGIPALEPPASWAEPEPRTASAAGRATAALGALRARIPGIPWSLLGALRARVAALPWAALMVLLLRMPQQLWSALRTVAQLLLSALGACREPLVRWLPRLAAAALLVAAAGGALWAYRAYGPSAAAAVGSLGASVRESVAAIPAPDAAPKAAPARAAGTAPAPAADAAGRIDIRSEPTGARVTVSGKTYGATPLIVENLKPGSYELLLEGADGSVRQRVQVAAGRTTELSVPIYSGWVHVSTPIELVVSVGSQRLVLDERNQALLPPGPRDLLFENRALGYRLERRVDIKPGETTRVAIEPVSSLTVTSTAEAEVIVDGQPAGVTPLLDHPLPLGSRDVVVRAPSGEERRFAVTATVEPVRLDADFAAP